MHKTESTSLQRASRLPVAPPPAPRGPRLRAMPRVPACRRRLDGAFEAVAQREQQLAVARREQQFNYMMHNREELLNLPLANTVEPQVEAPSSSVAMDVASTSSSSVAVLPTPEQRTIAEPLEEIETEIESVTSDFSHLGLSADPATNIYSRRAPINFFSRRIMVPPPQSYGLSNTSRPSLD